MHPSPPSEHASTAPLSGTGPGASTGPVVASLPFTAKQQL